MVDKLSALRPKVQSFRIFLKRCWQIAARAGEGLHVGMPRTEGCNPSVLQHFWQRFGLRPGGLDRAVRQAAIDSEISRITCLAQCATTFRSCRPRRIPRRVPWWCRRLPATRPETDGKCTVAARSALLTSSPVTLHMGNGDGAYGHGGCRVIPEQVGLQFLGPVSTSILSAGR